MEPQPCSVCGGIHAPGACLGSQEKPRECLRLPGTRVELPSFHVYEQQLGLQWPIAYTVDYSGKEDTAHIASFSGEHAIQLPLSFFIEQQKYKDLIVHELCHAALAERLDPAFASAIFFKKYGQLKGDEAQKFTKAVEQFYLAWCHIDLWVDKLRHSLWPDLTEQGHRNFVQAMQVLARARQSDAFQEPKNIIAIALNSLEEKRYGFSPFNVRKAAGEEVARPVRQLAAYYETLPPLSGRRVEDLALLQSSVQGAARMLKKIGSKCRDSPGPARAASARPSAAHACCRRRRAG